MFVQPSENGKKSKFGIDKQIVLYYNISVKRTIVLEKSNYRKGWQREKKPQSERLTKKTSKRRDRWIEVFGNTLPPLRKRDGEGMIG